MMPLFRSKNSILGTTLFFTVISFMSAQGANLEELPGLKESAVVIRIVSQIVEKDEQQVWNQEYVQVTIPGRPVGIKLVGSNLLVSVKFTPFLQTSGRHTLLVHGEIWIILPNIGASYNSIFQTIHLDFGEQVYFFPLGQARPQDEARIEMQLVLEPYTEGSESPGKNSGALSSP